MRKIRFRLSIEDAQTVRTLLDETQPHREAARDRRVHAKWLRALLFIVVACVVALVVTIARAGPAAIA